MTEPLSKSQQQLRGHDVRDMTLEQLHNWIDACTKMELWVKAAKARRSWRQEREAAIGELVHRREPTPNVVDEA